VGTSIEDLLRLAGGATVPDPAVINGGPMMGKLEEDLSAPVTKTTKGLIFLPKDHPRVLAKRRDFGQMLRIARTACCHCSHCTDLCPRYLLGHRLHPDKVMRLASYGHIGEPPERAAQVFLCCECGLCEMACVMNLQPWRLNRELKGRLGPAAAKALDKKAPTEVNRFREMRRYPIPKLIERLSLGVYDKLAAPLDEDAVRPARVELLLKQHLGVPGRPLVAVGDDVTVGQPVASPPEGATGAAVHASISGRVEKVDQKSVVIAAS
jgi:Na+-translocating ferredoxin:NAD+ oxidoreductase RnfC subunit